jgi:hypothetical protein
VNHLWGGGVEEGGSACGRACAINVLQVMIVRATRAFAQRDVNDRTKREVGVQPPDIITLQQVFLSSLLISL